MQFLHATKAAHFHWRARKKVEELTKENKKQEKANKFLVGQMKVAQENLKSAEDQLVERDATIRKLSQDLSAHDGDADTIERLKAELKGHAKDTETIKRYKDNLAKARREKKEADEKVSMLERRIIEADQMWRPSSQLRERTSKKLKD